MIATEKSLRRLADGLTASRVVIAMIVTVASYRADWAFVALLLSIAWWSDFFDGKLARRAGGGTRLGLWDLRVDTAVGAMLLLGMLVGGHISVTWGAIGVCFGIGYLLIANGSFAMVLQAIAYGHALWFALGVGLPGFAIASGTIAMIALMSWSWFLHEVIPSFLRGLVPGREREPKASV